ncbi:MAG: secondary thiamine-phosphate synthase enzyme YjbQ [Candidatus Omnitrophota bacterium]
MKVLTREINFHTQGDTDIQDITPFIQEELKATGLKNGVVFVFGLGSTNGITTCEYEPGLVGDLKELFEKLIPKNSPYGHDAAWGDGNGFSHLRASLLGSSLTIPFVKSALCLGTWQQVIFIDFDNRPRDRRVIIQFQGE